MFGINHICQTATVSCFYSGHISTLTLTWGQIYLVSRKNSRWLWPKTRRTILTWWGLIIDDNDDDEGDDANKLKVDQHDRRQYINRDERMAEADGWTYTSLSSLRNYRLCDNLSWCLLSADGSYSTQKRKRVVHTQTIAGIENTMPFFRVQPVII